MLRPNINLSRRISPDSRVIIAFLVSFMISVVSVIVILSSFGPPRSFAEAPAGEEEGGGLILGARELSPSQPTDTFSPTASSAPTPTPASIPTSAFIPTPSPTAIPQASEPPDSEGSAEPPEVGYYSGPALESASQKKDLLLLSDSLPDDWVVEQNEGTDFIPGKIGKALSLAPGNLVLSGGEIFANEGTLSFWLKLESEFVNGESPLLEWNFVGGDCHPSLFEISVVEDRLLFSFYDEEGNQDDVGGRLELPLEWHLVVVTWDLTKEPYERVLYIDGGKIASKGFPLAPTTANPSIFQIGGTLGARSPVAFTIDELVLTNWAKSESEIVQTE